jgi:spermidine synthase
LLLSTHLQICATSRYRVFSRETFSAASFLKAKKKKKQSKRRKKKEKKKEKKKLKLWDGRMHLLGLYS